MIGALNPINIPLALIPRAGRAGPRLEYVALCGNCQSAAGSPNARVCTRVDCGLAGRSHADRNAA